MFRKKKVPAEAPAAGQVVPVNLGIIMDGNGRWAKKRGRPGPGRACNRCPRLPQDHEIL